MITRAHIRRQLRKDGGIMSAVPRQGYFLGGVGRAIGKAVGKVGDVVGQITKSDIGKAALLGAGVYKLGGGAKFGGQGFNFRNIMPALFGGGALPPSQGLGQSTGLLSKFIPSTTMGKVAAAGALATGAALALPGNEQKKLDLLKERGGNVEAYLRQYYKSYYQANWQEGWTQEEEDEFVAANTTEYSKGGRVGLYGGGDPEMMDETLSPLQIMQDQGVPYSIPVDAGAKSITKEGVQMAGGPYNQGSDVKNALAVWNNMGPRDQEMFEGFLDFFRSGIWKDQIQGLRIQEENRKMASAPDPQDMMNDFAMEQFDKPLHELTPEQLQMLYDMANDQAALPQGEVPVAAAKGGRIKYGIGDLVKGRSKMVLKDFFNDEEEYAQGGRIGKYGGGVMGIGTPGMRLPGIPRMAADGMEYDMSHHGGFQPLGAKEGKDDVKANLAKNEFVMTADAVRGAGNGDIELGAQKMYDTMRRLENKVA